MYIINQTKYLRLLSNKIIYDLWIDLIVDYLFVFNVILIGCFTLKNINSIICFIYINM